MKTKKDVLETFKKYGICKDIYCCECPFDTGFCEKCIIGTNLAKLGAEKVLDNFKEEGESNLNTKENFYERD